MASQMNGSNDDWFKRLRAAREYVKKEASKHHLEYEILHTFHSFVDAEPMTDPMQHARDALYEWDI